MKTLASLINEQVKQLTIGYAGPTVDLRPDEYQYQRPQNHYYYDQEDQTRWLAKEFKLRNPTLLKQLRNAMSSQDYGFLVKQLSKGLFYAAATFSNPYVIGSGIVLKHLLHKAEREKKKQQFMQNYYH